MCCVAKENICFFLSSRLFFCYFDGLIVLLKSFSSSAGTSYALCLRKLRYRHNLFLPLAWPTKRGRELPVEKDFGKSASCHFSVYRPYFLRYGFQQDNFSDFSFSMFFLFLEAVVKAKLLCNSLIMSRYKIENKKRVTIWLLLKFPELPWFAVVSNNSCYWCKDK